jgi:hypothetical protein
MDAGSKKLPKDNWNARNSKPSAKIEVGQKGRTFYFERGNNVQSGTRQ